jgi:DNA-binding Lrp family transcriptional regulator
MMAVRIDSVDREIINSLQGGFGLGERPYLEAAGRIGISEDELIDRLDKLVSSRALSRFGPMYNAERLGGAVSLCAIAVPEDRFDAVAETVNAHREVAHNYARNHELNMWFVIACDAPDKIQAVIGEIEDETGLKVYDFPKEHEFFIGLRVEA